LDGVEEDLVSDFCRDGTVVEERILLGVDFKLAFMRWERLRLWLRIWNWVDWRHVCNSTTAPAAYVAKERHLWGGRV